MEVVYMQYESERIEYKSQMINVNDSCIEFISIGGLLPGLSADDIRSGISQPRNRKLAEIFHRLKLIESYGTGIRKIYARYRDCAAQPRIEVTTNTFKLKRREHICLPVKCRRTD